MEQRSQFINRQNTELMILEFLKDINNLEWELEDDMIAIHHKTLEPVLTLDAELFKKELWTI